MPGRNNPKVGKKGEAIAEDIILTEINGEFLFDPAFVGSTFPGIDFYVQLTPSDSKSLFFLAQVKSTYSLYDTKNNLKIKCTLKKLKELAKNPAPTYILGVDLIGKKVYARFIKSPVRKSLNFLPTNFELTPKNLKLLHKEVVNYWKNTKTLTHKKKFKSITYD
jgi:hypothetical protein